MTDFNTNGAGNSAFSGVCGMENSIGDETPETSLVQTNTDSGGGESPIGADAAPTDYAPKEDDILQTSQLSVPPNVPDCGRNEGEYKPELPTNPPPIQTPEETAEKNKIFEETPAICGWDMTVGT
jgi:hypothetical protein